jgi:hypothetical protein
VRLKVGAADPLHCLTINVSSNGLALNTPTPQKLGAPVGVDLKLPDGFTVQGKGVVIWDDKHGKTGVHFHSVTPLMQLKLDEWLDTLAAG